MEKYGHLLALGVLNFAAAIAVFCLACSLWNWSNQFPSKELLVGQVTIGMLIFTAISAGNSAFSFVLVSARKLAADELPKQSVALWLVTMLLQLSYLCLGGIYTVSAILMIVGGLDKQSEVISTIFSQLWQLAGGLGRNRMQDTMNCCGLTGADDKAVDSAVCPISISPDFAATTQQPGCLTVALDWSAQARPFLITALCILGIANLTLGFAVEFLLRRRRCRRFFPETPVTAASAPGIRTSNSYAPSLPPQRQSQSQLEHQDLSYILAAATQSQPQTIIYSTPPPQPPLPTPFPPASAPPLPRK